MTLIGCLLKGDFEAGMINNHLIPMIISRELHTSNGKVNAFIKFSRSLTRAQIFASNSMTENDEDLFEIESVLDDISTFCLLLRNSAYTLSNDRECGVTFDHFHNLIQVDFILHHGCPF